MTGANDLPVISIGSGNSAAAQLTEQANTTALTTADTASGTFTFADVDLNDTHSVAVALSTATPPHWSAGSTIPSLTLTDIQHALTATVATDSTGTQTGTIGWSFSLPDKDFDFLAARQTLTLNYDVTVTDSGLATSTQTVTVTITGTNDTPVITSSDSKGVTEDTDQTGQDTPALTTSGTLTFSDADLSDTHVTTDASSQPLSSLASAVWSNGTTPSLTQTAAAAALTTLVQQDSNGTGCGTLAWNFNLADHFADFLAKDETLTLTYDVKVRDLSGDTSDNTSAFQTVTVTITGTNDRPVITAGDAKGVTEATDHTGATGETTLATSGTLVVHRRRPYRHACDDRRVGLPPAADQPGHVRVERCGHDPAGDAHRGGFGADDFGAERQQRHGLRHAGLELQPGRPLRRLPGQGRDAGPDLRRQGSRPQRRHQRRHLGVPGRHGDHHGDQRPAGDHGGRCRRA